MYFKVKIGFGQDDFISIDQSELPNAIKAQITGKVGVFTEGTIAGNNIISITPDWNKLMGWKRGYKLTDEDYTEIGDKKIKEARVLFQEIKNKVLGIAPSPIEISEGVKTLSEKMQWKK